MRTCVLIILCFVFSLGKGVVGDAENEVKRGVYPFMAFIYYPDETLVDDKEMRYLRSAVLIRPEWLVTSAVGLSIDGEESNAFPRKTLLARVGALTIDVNFSLNEDEDEQEREVIQIIRPYNHSATQWWGTDISLMKTLLPFNLTTTVGVGSVSFERENADKTCMFLIYAKKFGNWTDDKILMQISVDLLPPSKETCGRYFVENTMICSSGSEAIKSVGYDPGFCQGNNGGPLICDSKIIGLQTYIGNTCKPPHLYQLLSAWENFITCSTEDKCQEEQCANICIVTNKDATTTKSTSTETSKRTYMTTARTTRTTVKLSTTIRTTTEVSDVETEVTPTLTSFVPTVSTKRSTKKIETASPTESITTKVTTVYGDTDTKPWPNEKYKAGSKKLQNDDDDDGIDRKINVEAQQQQEELKIKETLSSAHMNIMCIFQTFFIVFIVFACLI